MKKHRLLTADFAKTADVLQNGTGIAAVMADPRKNFGPPNPAFKIQLDEARAEWRRRHPNPGTR
jgi:hypothetical protein